MVVICGINRVLLHVALLQLLIHYPPEMHLMMDVNANRKSHQSRVMLYSIVMAVAMMDAQAFLLYLKDSSRCLTGKFLFGKISI